MPIIPEKLKRGDEVRVIAPSRSMSIISAETREIANKRFEEMGLTLSFGKHIEESDEFLSSSVSSRIEDLHDAFKDKNIKAILTVIGGFNSNQLLSHIDYELIKANPKIFCGFSDITVLQNTFLKKSDLATYSGPHYSTFGMEKGIEYIRYFFEKCLFGDKEIELKPTDLWSDDEWYLDQENREFIANQGTQAIIHGEAQGEIVGGNLSSLLVLQGTEYMPDLRGKILFAEECDPAKAWDFDRELSSILHTEAGKEIKGLLIGRFQKSSKITEQNIRQIITTKEELKNIPVIANLDFGHTTPFFTFPIGGSVQMKSGAISEIKIIKH